jgi:aspartyl-tRNA(Asn)/glutamyl-tRNA(Gln) amidotransferase subunit B
MDFEAVIGLEVHCQLLTPEKLFCGCPTRFGAAPNAHTCPICLGLPGVMPVLNEHAVELALRAGLGLDCTVNGRSVFSRKHYFYPDLPKGYQITQYDLPILEHGRLTFGVEGQEKTAEIVRIHMEEDAGKSDHAGDEGGTLVDLNRAGVPLIEIVGAPDLRSAAEATGFLKALRQVVRYLGVSDGNMQEGSFRCDANVSVRPRGQSELGTRTEIKNLNSFRGVARAIEYEIARQTDCVQEGRAVVQETRLWDDGAGRTRAMRSKEDAHDYRYFPEPDLPPLEVSEAWVARVRGELVELPAARRRRFSQDFGLSPYDAAVLTAEREVGDFYEAVVGAHPNAKLAANWVSSELLARVEVADLGSCRVGPEALGRLLELLDDGTISGRIAKQVFDAMMAGEGSPDAIIEAKGLRQVSDVGLIEALCRQVVADNPAQLAQYRAGRHKVRGFFVGQVMKASRGKANPQEVNRLLDAILSEDKP